jgi:hypothetical protein
MGRIAAESTGTQQRKESILIQIQFRQIWFLRLEKGGEVIDDGNDATLPRRGGGKEERGVGEGWK